LLVAKIKGVMSTFFSTVWTSEPATSETVGTGFTVTVPALGVEAVQPAAVFPYNV
jgi:hypothetical protein